MFQFITLPHSRSLPYPTHTIDFITAFSSPISLVAHKSIITIHSITHFPSPHHNGLQQIQKELVHTVPHTSKHSHIIPTLKCLQWLKVRQRMQFKIISNSCNFPHKSELTYLNKLITVKPTGKTFICPPLSLSLSLSLSLALSFYPHLQIGDWELYLHSKAAEIALPRVVSCIDAIDRWMSSNRLKLNAEKTQIIAFGLRLQLTKDKYNSRHVGGKTYRFCRRLPVLALFWMQNYRWCSMD